MIEVDSEYIVMSDAFWWATSFFQNMFKIFKNLSKILEILKNFYVHVYMQYVIIIIVHVYQIFFIQNFIIFIKLDAFKNSYQTPLNPGYPLYKNSHSL